MSSEVVETSKEKNEAAAAVHSDAYASSTCAPGAINDQLTVSQLLLAEGLSYHLITFILILAMTLVVLIEIWKINNTIISSDPRGHTIRPIKDFTFVHFKKAALRKKCSNCKKDKATKNLCIQCSYKFNVGADAAVYICINCHDKHAARFSIK